MNYELAKKLKDAGFPQKQKGQYINSSNEVLDYQLAYTTAYLPTLEELIKACGEDFGCLYPSQDGWIAEKGLHVLQEEGETPTDAVANLWLALKKV